MSDAIYAGKTSDMVLNQLLEVIVTSIREDQPIFSNPLHEPILYRRLKRWVEEGLAEAAAAKAIEQKALKDAEASIKRAVSK